MLPAGNESDKQAERDCHYECVHVLAIQFVHNSLLYIKLMCAPKELPEGQVGNAHPGCTKGEVTGDVMHDKSLA